MTTSHQLTWDEADAVIRRTGGWEKLRQGFELARINTATLTAYTDSTPYDAQRPWVAAVGGQIFTGESFADLRDQLERAELDIKQSSTMKRLPPDLKIMLSVR